MTSASRYLKSCEKVFWQKIFRIELAYLIEHLQGCRDILSVGCGPAIIEDGMVRYGFNVTGLDISYESLRHAPARVRTVVGNAECMPFLNNSFDAAIFVASLQFIENYRTALTETAFVLRPCSRIIVMLLNPESGFYQEKSSDPDSYVRSIRHTDLREIETALSVSHAVRTEYFLGVRKRAIFESKKATEAVLYVIEAWKCPQKTEEVKEKSSSTGS